MRFKSFAAALFLTCSDTLGTAALAVIAAKARDKPKTIFFAYICMLLVREWELIKNVAYTLRQTA